MNKIVTVLCYIEQDGKYLMLHRTKKENDINKDKWIGVGGKLENDESPEEALIREVKEETGLTLHDYKLRGVLTFSVDAADEVIYCFTYTSDDFSGELCDCDEGELKWVDKDKVNDLNLWEGDRKMFEWLLSENFFSAKIVYDKDDNLKLCDVKIY